MTWNAPYGYSQTIRCCTTQSTIIMMHWPCNVTLLNWGSGLSIGKWILTTLRAIRCMSIGKSLFDGILMKSGLLRKHVSSVFGFVKRNLYSCSEATKGAAYITLVRPHLEYGSAVWGPYKQESKNKWTRLTFHLAIDNNIALPSWHEFHQQNVLK